MNNRLHNLQKFLKQNDLPALFITSEINRKYLSGFSGSKGDLLVFAKYKNLVLRKLSFPSHSQLDWESALSSLNKKQIPAFAGMTEKKSFRKNFQRLSNRVFLFTDSRYSERAREESCNGVEVVVVDKNYLVELKMFLKQAGVKKLGIEADSMNLRFYDNLKRSLRGVELTKTEDVIKNIRAVKDEEEIKKLKKAIALTDETFGYIFKFIKKSYKKGITEKQIAWEMEKFIRENKGADLSFESIVASGKNSAIPHHLTGARKIKKGDMLLLDFGAMFEGYHADMSRTLFIGKPAAKQKETYECVLKVQKEIIKMIKPGIVCGELDKRAREIFEKFGCCENFLHGLGHGVGLEIHEFPSMHQTRAGNDIRLKPNMIFTVEPGIYYSGWGGVRIEDIVLVTAKGKQVLSQAPKELREIIV